MNVTNTKKILKIGKKLIEGPRSILLLPKEYEWLEKELYITIYEPEYAQIKTYSIWVDCTMNKFKNFLPPMIRILTWNRKKDFEILKENKLHNFPSIEVEIGLIKKDKFNEVNSFFIELQRSLIKENSYELKEISLKRDCAETKTDYKKEYIDYSIYVWNGVQSIEYFSCDNLRTGLADKIIAMKNLLIESIEPTDKSNWIERYNGISEDFFEGITFDWNYKFEKKKNKS